MNPIIEEEIMQNHNQADAFISLFFAGLDAVTYIVILTLFGCELKGCFSPKQKLSLFLILDGVLRIINMYIDAYSKTFVQETVFSLIVTLQFYLSISILEQVFTDRCNGTKLESEFKIKNKTLLSFLFFCLVFSFKGLMTSYGLLSCLQYICILVSISVFYKYIGNKIDLFLSNITKKNNQFHGQNFINNLPFFILIYFMINYILQLCSLMIENKLYESYMVMVCTVFKEVGKYLVILLLIAIYHSFNKYVKEYDFGFSSENNNTNNKSADKNKVQVYKDEEEVDEP